MFSMTPFILTTLILLPHGAAPVDPVQKPDVVTGLWLSEDRSAGGLGAWFELRPEGTVKHTIGALVEFTYRWQGTSLSITEAGKTHHSIEMRIDGDSAVRRQEPPPGTPPRDQLSAEQRALLDKMTQPLKMKRVGAATPGAPPIVGTWMYEHYTGATAYERFSSGGRMILLVDMQISEGTYAVHPDRIVLDLPEGAVTFERKGEVLIAVIDGKSRTFRRAPQ